MPGVKGDFVCACVWVVCLSCQGARGMCMCTWADVARHVTALTSLSSAASVICLHAISADPAPAPALASQPTSQLPLAASDLPLALATIVCQGSAMLAGELPAVETALQAHGRHLGIAYQLVDDLLGFTGSADATGSRPVRACTAACAAAWFGRAPVHPLAHIRLAPFCTL